KLLSMVGFLLSCAVGALYYFSREPVYEAQASVLVHRTGDAWPGRSADLVEVQQDYLPTHIRLMTSSAVLSRAIERLRSTATRGWLCPGLEQLARGLRVESPKDTEILEISYQTA